MIRQTLVSILLTYVQFCSPFFSRASTFNTVVLDGTHSVVVSTDGNDDYKTIQEVIDSPLKDCSEPYRIYVKNGDYIDHENRKTRFKNSNNELGVSKVVLTDAEASSYTYDKVILGDDKWDPRKFISIKPEIWM